MKKIAPIIILAAVSAILIFYRFSAIPKNLAFDEVEFAKLALSLQNKPYIPYSTLATGHSTLYFYILLTSLKTFGITNFALRFPAAVFGILSVLFFYLIMRKIFQPSDNETMKQSPYSFLTPFLLSCLLLTSHWFLNFARFSFEVTFLLFLELTSIYFILIANVKITNFLRLGTPPPKVRGGFPSEQKNLLSNIYLIGSGLFAGLAFLSYIPGRIFFVLPLFLIFIHNIGRIKDLSLQKNKKTMKQLINETIKYILLFTIPFVITITPLTIYLSTHIDTRIDQEFFMNNHQVTIPVKIAGLWHNISTTALMFNVKGDVNGRQNYPNKPALNPVLGTLFLLGLAIAIWQWKKNNNKMFLAYFILSIFPALMTYPWENPSMLRTFTAIPSVIFFAGLTIAFIFNLINKYIHKKIFRYLILYTLYFLLAFSCFYELRTYFKYQSTVFNQAFEIKLPLDKAIKVKNKI